MWLQRIDAKIAAVRKRQAEQEHGQRSRPRPPDWVVQLGIGVGRPPVQIHTGDCHMKGTRLRPVDRDEARRLLTTGLRACTHCQPDTQLHILDLATHHPPAGGCAWAAQQVLEKDGSVASRLDTLRGLTLRPRVQPHSL